ncbi:hypothetical protein GPJ56_002499 [Histomonas meleagridis]|uniref:uncharacterized protein n=1 Tax=Histomonas meleagridis TaxID=135588 RepID=UPI003559E458|nr:hypothetical protein GPJ56_002499 [Histomonas meleagridis]KAH0806037.1 hypothetical protein GO595_001198 [Histomonas meleagridis]
MTLKFCSHLLPNLETEKFGFVQSSYSPEISTDYTDKIQLCKRCKSSQFPLKSGGCACPICTPEADFIDGTIKVGNGFESRHLFYLVLDLSFSIETVKDFLLSFAESLNSDDSAVIISIAEFPIMIYCDNGIPYFLQIKELSSFVPSDQYEVTKEDIKSIIIPSLNSLYSIFIEKDKISTPIDITFPIQIITEQSDNRPFATFFMIHRSTQPLSPQRAVAAGQKILLHKGIIHFGASEGFRRLTAIAKHSFGCVFGLSTFNPNTFCKLMKLSQPLRLDVTFPRFIEVSKVTSCEGDMKMTSLVTILQLSSGCGCSSQLSIDFSRISDTYKNCVNAIETSISVSGKFLTLHKFSWADSSENYQNSLSLAINKEIALKSFASDVLRGVWNGTNYEKLINNIDKSVIVESCFTDIGKKPERDSLRLYYMLHSVGAHKKNEMIQLPNGGCMYMYPPVVFVRTDEDVMKVVNDHVKCEWPFDVQVFKEMDSFRIVVESLSGNAK